MSDTPQDTRPLQISFPDVPEAGAVLTGFSGTETLSSLFEYTLSLSVPSDSPLTFDQLLGKPAAVTVHRAGEDPRYVHGLISRMSQGARSDRFLSYSADLVPALWLLTRMTRSRIFQQKTTEEIIREVVGGLCKMDFRLKATYHPRNYTTQYRETDFDFLSRLIEEEGIYYYFTHTADEAKLVFSDSPMGHDVVPGISNLTYQEEGSSSTETVGRVTRWTKAQQLRTAKFTLRDHSFELPTNPLEATRQLPESVKAGTVTHSLAWPESEKTESTDVPGGYVRWRDGIDQGGSERPGDLDPLFEENVRLVRVRSEAELVGAVEIDGVSTFPQLTPGHKFTLTEHPDSDGEYVVTGITHSAKIGEAASGGELDSYTNEFTCIPIDVPFRPQLVTPRPFIRGTQTAVVVGADDKAEIEPDKYGRVKVWFRWDPAGPRNLDSSCWVRVAQFWAGRQWGGQFLPRVGDEVVVSFLDGDPDRPLIIGSVYNADNMPIYDLPANKTQSGIKTHSSPGGTSQNYNEIMFEDKKGSELVSIHAEKDMAVTIEDNHTVGIGAFQKDPHKAGMSTTTIYGDTKTTVSKGDYYLNVATGKSDTQVKADTTVTIHEGNHTFTVSKGVVTEVFQNRQETNVKGNVDLTSAEGDIKMTAAQKVFFVQGEKEVKVTSVTDAVNIYAKTKILLSVGKSSLTLNEDGTIELVGVAVTMHGSKTATVSGPEVDLTGDKKAVVGVSSQTVLCDMSKVAVSGSMIKAAATGTHEITGSLVKIN